MDTLLLDQSTWDLCVDASGNIAVASNPYSLAQDAASACRLFQTECWYDTTRGIPYFDQVLGQLPPAGLMKSLLTNAALTVPEVTDAAAFLTGLVDRTLSAQLQVRAPGSVVAVNIALPPPVP